MCSADNSLEAADNFNISSKTTICKKTRRKVKLFIERRDIYKTSPLASYMYIQVFYPVTIIFYGIPGFNCPN